MRALTLDEIKDVNGGDGVTGVLTTVAGAAVLAGAAAPAGMVAGAATLASGVYQLVSYFTGSDYWNNIFANTGPWCY